MLQESLWIYPPDRNLRNGIVRQGWDETNKAEEMFKGWGGGLSDLAAKNAEFIIFKTLLLLIMMVMTVEDLHERRPCPAQQLYSE